MLSNLLRYLPLLLVPMSIQSGLAQKTCSNADLKGLYGFSATGRIFLPADTPITGPFARAGFATIDGAGELLITSTASYNGLIFTEEFPGTYEVKPDCTFTYIANLGQPINFPVQFTGVIYDGGKRADFMLVTPPPDPLSNATIVRQDKASCSSADMAGSYALYSSGTIIAPAESAGRMVRMGVLTATEGGSLKLSSTVSYSGAVQQEDYRYRRIARWRWSCRRTEAHPR